MFGFGNASVNALLKQWPEEPRKGFGGNPMFHAMQTSAQTAAEISSKAIAQAAAAAEAAAQVERTAVIVEAPPASPQVAWEAARAARNELRSQLDVLVSQRHTLLNELEDHPVPGPASQGMQQRISQLDARIAALDIEVAKADAAVAAAAAIPGVVVDPPRPPIENVPEEVAIAGILMSMVVLLPISIAIARRIWRRASGAAPAALSRDLTERLARLEQMGEATALEVERIGEGQRFVTRILTEKDPALPDGMRH